MDNRSEQFLDVDLPAGATLWSVEVVGKSVKPATPSNAIHERRVRIPLTKSAAGDLDFEVVFKYGGKLPFLGAIRHVDFPMPHSVNIPVELSQATLFLPEEFRWFDFGGTMRLVEDGAELAAGYVQYETRQTERLGVALANQSPFAQARASSNLREVRTRVERLRNDSRLSSGNQSLSQEFLSNEVVLERVQLQQQQIDLQSATSDEADNRTKLSNCFDVQQVGLARNTLQGAADNFDTSAIVALQDQKVRASFDENWLQGNNEPATALAQADKIVKADRRVQTQEEVQAMQNRPNAPVPDLRVFKNSFASKSAEVEGVGAVVQQAQNGRSQRGAELGNVAMEYKKQLVKSTGEQDDEKGELGVPRSRTQSTLADRESFPGVSVDFPVRGTAYYFTTPRGAETITARAISRRFTERAIRLVVVLLAIGVVSLAAWVLSRQNFARLFGRRVANWMIALGIISLLSGLLPVVGLFAAIGGFALRSRIRIAETFSR